MKKTDYTGKKVGWLTVLKELPKQKKNDVVWLCQCDCGKMINRTSAYLRTVGTASCGCYAAEHHKMQRKDITGKRFGKLVAVEPTGNMSERRQCIWRFRCDCGNIIERPAPEITKRNNPNELLRLYRCRKLRSGMHFPFAHIHIKIIELRITVIQTAASHNRHKLQTSLLQIIQHISIPLIFFQKWYGI